MIIKENFKIKGMTCSHCVKSVEQELSGLPLNGFSVSIGNAFVEYSDKKVSTKQIYEVIKNAGYEVEIDL